MRTQLLADIVTDLDRADRLERQARGIQFPDPNMFLLSRAATLRANCDRHLVFADWLEENGEERFSELVRLECEEKRLECQVWCSLSWPTDKKIGDECNNTDCPKCGKLHPIRQRIASLRKELNPFAESVQVEWDRGLIVGTKSALLVPAIAGNRIGISDLFDDFMLPIFTNWPIRTITLTDWHSIERSLPRDPNALPWLRTLRIPSVITRTDVMSFFGLHPDHPNEPRVRVEFVEAGFERVRNEMLDAIIRNQGIPSRLIGD